jgi:hypothetical protein
MDQNVNINGTVSTSNATLEANTLDISKKINNLSDIIKSTIEENEIDNVKSIRQTILNDTIPLKNKPNKNNNTNTTTYFDKPFKVQLAKPDYFDPVILKDQTMRSHYVRSLAFEIAKDLYTYVDFNKVKSNRDWAKECINRAVDFAEVYLTYVVKGLDSSFKDVEWEKPAPVVSTPDISDLKNTIDNNNTNNSENNNSENNNSENNNSENTQPGN